MAGDPFGALAADPRTAEAAEQARAAIDALLWRRDIRSAAAAVAAASVERGGRDSAAIDGADVVTPDESPMGRVLANALAVTAAVPAQLAAWSTAPLQALAALHAVASAGFLADEARGRPRTGEPDDPLHLGPAPDRIAPRLAALAAALVAPATAPAIVVAGVVHAELMVLRPFAWGSGLVARAAARCVLADRGADPSLFTIPERGMLAQGRPAYVAAIRGYRDGGQEGAAQAVIWFADSCRIGAEAVEVPEVA